MTETTSLPTGRYRHYKGNEYTVVGVARHSETLEELVVYRQEYAERGLWVRPKAMFTESVQVDGEARPRFQPVEANDAPLGGPVRNLFEDLPRQLPDEIVQTLLSAPHVRIERIVSHGQSSPAGFFYEQDQAEWVMLLRGAARLTFDDGTVDLHPGDFLNIPAHTRHRVDWTTPDEQTLWLAVHYDG